MLLNKIAEQLHVHLIGNGGIAVSGITYADVATEDQIAISMSRSEAMRTAAKVVLTNKILLGIDKTLARIEINTENLYGAELLMTYKLTATNEQSSG